MIALVVMDTAALITAFVTLFVVIDPIGVAPLFVALTPGLDSRRRLGIAVRACVIGAGVLTLFGLLGEAVLAFAGITMPAFRIAGGLLLFLTALDMLFERRTKRRSDQHAEGDDDPSVFPLAIPLIAGPGSIATMILLTTEQGADWSWIAAVHGVMFLVLGLSFLLMLAAGPIERVLRPTGITVVTRLLGMLLAALSVQFVLDGFADFGFLARLP